MEATIRKTQVLVVGGGLAGCWAALRAAQLGMQVTLVDKAMVARSGSSTFAAGVMLAPQKEDDLEDWRRELVEAGEYLNDQNWVNVMLEDQIQRIDEMQSWGLAFEQDADGQLARRVGRGHHTTRILMFHGKKLMEGMRAQLEALANVQLVERTMITDLLVQDQGGRRRVIGAAGFHARSGEPVVFEAPAVIIASGPMAPRTGGGMVDNLSGDGVAMAFRAGVQLLGMEFCLCSNIVTWERRFEVAGINMLQGAGAKLINSLGERFMPRYNPELAERSTTAVLARAFAKEALEGRGPIAMDMRHFTPDDFERFRRVIPKTMRVFNEAGVNPAANPIECTPAIKLPGSSSGNGGIRISLDCRANLDGLLAAGASSKDLAHGTYSVGGVNLAYCCVSGYRAGETAAQIAQDGTGGHVQQEEAIEILRHTMAPLGRNGNSNADAAMLALRQTVVPAQFSLFPSGERMRQVLQKLEQLEALELGAADVHQLVKAVEVKNLLSCARLKFTAGLLREESRGDHYREEFPYRDDVNWLKWITVQKNGEEMALNIEDVPLEQYPVRPLERRRIPAPVQYQFNPAN